MPDGTNITPWEIDWTKAAQQQAGKAPWEVDWSNVGQASAAPQYTAQSPFVVDPKAVTPDALTQWMDANPGAHFRMPDGTLRRVKMPTPEEVAKEQAASYDLSGSDAVEGPSVPGVAGRAAIAGVVPAATGVFGMGAGAALGAGLGSFAGPVGTAAGAIVGGIGGALGLGYGGELLQEKALEAAPGVAKFLGQDPETRREDIAAHPYWYLAGKLAPNAALIGPGLTGPAARAGASALERVMTQGQIPARAVGAGLMGAQDAALQLYDEGKIDPQRLAIVSGFGAALTKPTALGRGLMRAGDYLPKAGYSAAFPDRAAEIWGTPSPHGGPPGAPPGGGGRPGPDGGPTGPSPGDIFGMPGEGGRVEPVAVRETADGVVYFVDADGLEGAMPADQFAKWARPIPTETTRTEFAPEQPLGLPAPLRALPPPETIYGEGFTMPPDGGAVPSGEPPAPVPEPPRQEPPAAAPTDIEAQDSALRQGLETGQPEGSAAVEQRLAEVREEIGEETSPVPRGTEREGPAEPPTPEPQAPAPRQQEAPAAPLAPTPEVSGISGARWQRQPDGTLAEPESGMTITPNRGGGFDIDLNGPGGILWAETEAQAVRQIESLVAAGRRQAQLMREAEQPEPIPPEVEQQAAATQRPLAANEEVTAPPPVEHAPEPAPAVEPERPPEPTSEIPKLETPRHDMIGTGDVLRTQSGRLTAPAPRIAITSDRTATNTIRRLDDWLLSEAKKEAEAIGNDYWSTLLRGIDTRNMSPSDRDSLNMMLWGDTLPSERNRVPEPSVPPTEARPEAPRSNTEESKTRTVTNDPTVSDEKHTKTGKDLYAVRFPQKPDIDGLGAQARKLGGYWSSYRGGGARPGWMFKTRESADRFAEWARKEQAPLATATFRDPYAGDVPVELVKRGEGFVWERAVDREVGVRAISAGYKPMPTVDRAVGAVRNDRRFSNVTRREEMGEGLAAKAADQPPPVPRGTSDETAPPVDDRHPGLVIQSLETGKQTIQAVEGGRQFPAYTLEQLRSFLAQHEALGTNPQMQARLAEEIRRRESGESQPRVTPQLTPSGERIAPPESIPTAKASAEVAEQPPQLRLADWIQRTLEGKIEPDARTLVSAAEHAFGSKLSEGKFTRSDIYDAMELGVNRYIRAHEDNFDPRADLRLARQMVRELEDLKKSLPTQTVRAGEKDSMQQFSTPPDYAFAAAWAAKIGPHDRVIEPSAGTGSLAVHAMNAKPEAVYVNELSKNRAPLVESLGPDRAFRENAEQLHNILPEDVKPTVVVMNPPFSQTAGRMGDKTVLTTGARHIEQALSRLEPGGRLVAIVGRGMSMSAPTFRNWWAKIGREYDIRANVGVEGKVYQKYGTNFATRMLVIDKNAPSGRKPMVADVETIPDLMETLEGVRNDRAERTPGTEQLAAEPSGEASPDRGRGTPGPAEPVSGAAPATGLPERPADAGSGRGVPAGTGERSEPAVRPGPEAGPSDALVPQQPERGGSGGGDRVPDAGTGRPGDLAGSGAEPDAMVLRPEGEPGSVLPPRAPSGTVEGDLPEVVKVQEAAAGPETAGPITENVYEPYKPQRITIRGAAEHPTKLVQSAAMASVMPPDVAYIPKIPPAIIKDGKLSAAQLEAITYAGHAHSQMLPEMMGHNGGPPMTFRRGFFIGDGTGVGKGAQVAGIMLDNWMQGRQKALWVSESRALIKDAQRDWQWVGRDPKEIFDFGKVAKPGAELKQSKGVGFLTYDTLKGAEKAGKDDQGKTIRGKSRVDQIVEWLGKDFDGVIAFDESHNLGNSVQIRGARGMSDPAQKALAGIELQERLPNARVVYVSATGATEVMNLAYAERLGLWGPGTAFPNKREFISKISSGGVAAMELVARDMKAMGSYIARNLAFDGVEYDRLEHRLTADQRRIYDDLADGWQSVLQNIEQALIKTTGTENAYGEAVPDRAQRTAALSAFWSGHQRFFNQIITSMQMPSVIKAIERDLKDGKQAVLQLVNTNEASQKRAISRAKMEEGDLEDLDMTPRDQLMQLIEKSFPTRQRETYLDENGNERTRDVVDSAGNPVENPEALAMKNALLEKLGSIRVPDGPLEMLINRFGPDNVAEITGRKERVVRKPDEKGVVRTMTEPRPGSANLTEADAFQGGKKKILVFSQAGMTGRSYHADLGSESANARRSHYLVQAGWRADKALQGFGRTHRTNQASAPIFNLVTTDLQGQRRFMSSIARRLAQLGALTKGERRAGESGMFSARDNLESNEAKSALGAFWRDLQRGNLEDVIPRADFERQTGLKLRDANGNDSEPPEITQFLNRLLSLKYDMQNRVFGEFETRLDTAVERAAEQGTLDVGTETLKADRIAKEDDRVVHTDPQSGAETRYVRLKVENKTKPRQFEDVAKGKGTGRNPPTFYVAAKQSGKVYAVSEASNITDSEGRIIPQYRLTDPLDYRFTDRNKIDGYGADKYWERIEDQSDAKRRWDEQVAKIPEYRAHDEHLITGAILPIWDRLGPWPRVYRLQTDAGEKLLGRTVSDREIDNVLRKLGAEGAIREYTPAQVAEQILEGGRATLANDWSLRRSTVANEPRIELVGPDYSHNAELANAGVFTERIGYQTRYFVPTGQQAETILASILQRRPIVEMIRNVLRDESGAGWNPFSRYAEKVERDAIDEAIGPPNVPKGPGWSTHFFSVFGMGPNSKGRGEHFFNPVNKYSTAASNAARYDIGGVSAQKERADRLMREDAARFRNTYAEMLETYRDASPEEMQRLVAFLELERLQGKQTPLDGRMPVTRNAGAYDEQTPLAYQPMARHSRPGEVLKLDTERLQTMYGELRRTMDQGWSDYARTTAERYGWFGEPSQKAIMEAAATETGREARRLERIAKLVGAIEYARRTAYVPFMRFGDYYFHVLPKEGAAEWLQGEGKRPTVWFSLMESRTPIEKMLGGRRQGSSTAKAYRAELEKRFPSGQYEIREGYWNPTENELRSIGIPAIEKLFSLIGNDTEKMWRSRAKTAEVVEHPSGSGFAIRFADGEYARAERRGKTPGDILRWDNPTDADVRRVASEAYEMQEQAIESLLDQVYSEMQAGFKKRARNTPGYDEDLTRSIGTYINWLSSNLSNMKHRDAIDAANLAVDNSYDPRAKQYWRDHDAFMERERDGVLENGTRAARNAAYHWYLGMNLASTIKNTLDGPMVHMPALAAGLGKENTHRAAAAYLNASRDVLKTFHVGPDGLDVRPMDAARTPAERALVQDAERSDLLRAKAAQEMGALARGGIEELSPQQSFNRRALEIWQSNMSSTDRLMRTAMLLSAYRMAKKVGMDRINRFWGKDRSWAIETNKTPEEWAKFMVRRVVPGGGEANISPMLRNPVGALVGQFQTYSLNYLSTAYQLMRQMGPEGRAAAAMMMGGAFLTGGLMIIPFATAAIKASEAVYNFFSDLDIDLKTELMRAMEAMGFAKQAGEIVLHGFSRSVLGIDLSSLDVTNFLNDFGRSGGIEAIGPVGGLASLPFKAYERWKHGESAAAVAAEIMPTPVKSFIKGIWVYPEQGARTLRGGANAQVLTPQQIGTWERGAATVGFPSAKLARAYEQREMARRAGELAKQPTAELNKRLEGLAVRAAFARQRGDAATATRLEAQIQAAIKSAPAGAKPTPEAIKKAVGQALNPQLGGIRQAPRAARPGILNSPYVQP